MQFLYALFQADYLFKCTAQNNKKITKEYEKS